MKKKTWKSTPNAVYEINYHFVWFTKYRRPVLVPPVDAKAKEVLARLAGIAVRADVDERGTSRTCHACGKVKASNRKHRGLYTCSCGWKAQADVNGALNIYERAFQVSPIKGSSGRVARPVVLSFHLGWHTVHEPERKCSLRASLRGCPRIYSGEDVTYNELVMVPSEPQH